MILNIQPQPVRVASTSTMEKDGLSEREKMVLGLPYYAMDDMDLARGRLKARQLTKKYNVSTKPSRISPSRILTVIAMFRIILS